MRIAAAQIHPAWVDGTAATDRIVDRLGRAAADGFELVAFGEALLSGHPFWDSIRDAG